jgi:hypothetical protein
MPDDAPTNGRWTDAELDEWFHGEFGGNEAVYGEFGMYGRGYLLPGQTAGDSIDPDLLFGLDAYRDLAYDRETESFDEQDPWPLLSREAKTRLRHGWERHRRANAPREEGRGESVVDELAAYPPTWDYSDRLPAKGASTDRSATTGTEPAVDELAAYPPLSDSSTPVAKTSPPRWMLIGGGIGILGLVLMAVFLLSDDEGPEDISARSGATTAPPTTEAVTTAPPTTEATTTPTSEAAASTVTSAAAVDTPDAPAAPFPTTWSYTATKTRDIVPAPDFITPTPVGAELPWLLEVTERCSGERCSYATVYYPLVPEALLGDVPETAWVIDGTSWTLDVTYQTVQSRNADGTVCVIQNRELFELAVTGTDGAANPTTFEGTWTQEIGLDLAASTGDVEAYCGDTWQVIDEWSLEGTTS